MSTRHLLTMAMRVKHLHIDATYRLIIESYPVVVVGVTNTAKSVVVIPSETTDDYSFVFQSLRKGVENEMKMKYQPTYLVADCALAITSGFQNTFGIDFKRVYCYFHVKKAYKKHIKVRNHKNALIKDIDDSRLSPSQEIN